MFVERFAVAQENNNLQNVSIRRPLVATGEGLKTFCRKPFLDAMKITQ